LISTHVAILANPTSRGELRDFLESEFSSESVEFCEAVEVADQRPRLDAHQGAFHVEQDWSSGPFRRRFLGARRGTAFHKID